MSVPLPCFFPSISSVKANLSPVDYLEILHACGHSQFLISAYDIANADEEHQRRIKELLITSGDNGGLVLFDSGNYESYWLRDQSWTVERFLSVAEEFPCNLCFSFDSHDFQDEPSEIARAVIQGAERDQKSCGGTVVPIVHARPETLPDSVKVVAESLFPTMIAVAERELGDGITERAKTVTLIRQALDSLGYYCSLHLLGTGNPLSILVYAAAGADSFDGLEWCQTVVDHRDGRLYHLQQWDWFREQTAIGQATDVSHGAAVLFHNLAYYGQWLVTVSDALRNGLEEKLLNAYLPDQNGLNLVRRREREE